MFHDINLSQILNGIPHAVMLVDTDFMVAAMNRQAEALTGRSADEAQGVWADFILRSNLHPFERLFAGVFEDGHALSREGDILDRNRKIIPIRFTISRVSDSSGILLGAMVVMEDRSHETYLEEKSVSVDDFGALVSLSPRMQEVAEQIPVFAGTDASVLIDGETGTGKGSVAETIHKASKRAGFPYIKVNCGALPQSLLESELFGHARGVFAGADRERQGMLRLADRGTIFFTEISDMPPALQAKLLTVLDDGEFSPLGSTKKVAVNVRIIAATSRDLKAMVQEGRFREDLFYRLQVLRLNVPALRDRIEDIPVLVDHFVKSFSPGNSAPQVDANVLGLLKHYSFPGNVRELRNIVEYAVTLCQGKTIRADHLPEYVLHGGEDVYPPAPGGRHAARQGASAADDRNMKWEDVEKEMIIDALRKSRGKKNEAARKLGWARSTLYRKLKHYGI